MGIGDPERNATDTYERDKPIVPECIKSSENEIPVKQYNIAVLRNLLRFERAEGRLQVTNKRVVFRAAGRSIGGRTSLQQEFAINELSGIEAQRGFRFGFIYLVFGFIVLMLTMSISAGIFGFIDNSFAERRVERTRNQIERRQERYQTDTERNRNRHSENWDRMQDEQRRLDERFRRDMHDLQERLWNPRSGFTFFGVVKFLIGVAGIFTFFWFHRKWLLKLAILGISFAAFSSPSRGSYDMFDMLGSPIAMLFGSFNLFTLITIFIIILGLALYSLKPDFVLLIKTKCGLENASPIKIQRSRGFWMWHQNGDTGFAEVFPTNESEGAIREINAMINDIQKMGDLGLEKWISK
jgi:hypothetical protein